MRTKFDFTQVAVSWTKYDVVHVLDTVESWETMQSYYSKEIPMDSSVLRAFVGVNDLSEPIPAFWKDLFQYDLRIRKAFAFFLMLFSHYKIASCFANRFLQGPFTGKFVLGLGIELGSKEQTNIRSLLVESGLSSARYRRSRVVPFDGSILLNEIETGPVFKLALENYIRRNSTDYYPDSSMSFVLKTDSIKFWVFQNKLFLIGWRESNPFPLMSEMCLLISFFVLISHARWILEIPTRFILSGKTAMEKLFY